VKFQSSFRKLKTLEVAHVDVESNRQTQLNGSRGPEEIVSYAV
jgi:hypothetical protein